MANYPDDSPVTPDTPPKRTAWRLTKQKIVWIVVGLVVLAAAIGGFIWYQNSQTDKVADADGDSRQDTEGPITMTIEERYRFDNIKRAEGLIKDVDGNKLVLEQSNGKPLEFQLIGDTQYVSGEQAYAGDKESLAANKKASISYDQNNMYIQTIWVDYDVASSN